MEKQSIVVDTPSEFDGDPRWQLVLRVIASPQFTRSARLKTFLQYVARCALLDHAEKVTEQQIGIHVFGRPASYNAGDDNIVRSQARFLRTKLAEYFDSAAGQHEAIVLTIPKGSYLPHFAARAEAAPVEIETPAVEVEAPQPSQTTFSGSRKIWVTGGVAILILAAGLMLFLWPREHAQAARPPGAMLWSRIFDVNRQTTIVASDYIFSMVQEAAGRTLTLDEYLSADYFSRVSQLNAVSGLDRLFPNIAQRHYTGFENVTSVARLLGMKQAQAARTVVRFAREMTMREVAAGNLILLGSKQSNPWDALFEDKLNFRFEYQGAAHNINIHNRAPRTGERSEYQPSALDAPSREIYGGIAFLPNLNRESNVLILQGTSMAGLEVALEVLDNTALFKELVRQVGAGRKEGELPHFEALIRTRTLNGVAGESAVVASRVIGE